MNKRGRYMEKMVALLVIAYVIPNRQPQAQTLFRLVRLVRTQAEGLASGYTPISLQALAASP